MVLKNGWRDVHGVNLKQKCANQDKKVCELAGRINVCVLRWFGHMDRMDGIIDMT